jgi:hypothetical protein
MQGVMIAYAIFAAIVILIVGVVLVAAAISAIIQKLRQRKAHRDRESPGNS